MAEVPSEWCKICGRTITIGEACTRENCPRAKSYDPIPCGRDPLLQEREKTHGSFKRNAELWAKWCYEINTQELKNNSQRLAVVMILLKLARAICNPTIKEHWDDIAGYAKLGSEACE